jgi:ribonuclease Z
MKVIILGTSSGIPTPSRNVSALAIFVNGRWLLFDCGEATQHRLQLAPVRLGQLDAIFFTHLHGDHLYGLPGLLASLSLQHRQQPLNLYGPRGLRDFIMAALRFSATRLSYELLITEVEAGTIRQQDGYRVDCLPLYHRVPDFGYSVIEDDRLGRFDVAQAQALGIPAGPLYGRLQAGETITLPDGRMIDSNMVVGPRRAGRRITYCTDTRPCSNSIKLAKNANLLIHEATYNNEHSQEAQERGHSTAAQAAEVARAAQARKLLLTHFSPRYPDTTSLLHEARRIFPATEAARDLLEVDVPLPD